MLSNFGGDIGVKIEGAGGDDIIRGGAGADILDGGIGSDFLFGGAGDDTFIASPGDDVILTGPGFDALQLGHDFDLLDGEINSASGDLFLEFSNGSTITVRDHVFEPLDQIVINTDDGPEIYAVTGGDMDARAFGDSLVFGSDASDTLFGGAGDDQIFVSAGFDTINSGSGDDVARFRGLMSDYSFEGSADGYSVITVIDPLNGDTTIIIGVETLSFADGAVDVSYEDTGIVLTATGNSDNLTLTGPHSIAVYGREGNDFIYGADGSDTLRWWF